MKEINIKNLLFFNEMINIEDFNSNLLKTDKKSYKNVGIYYIGCTTIKIFDDYGSIPSVNALYLTVDEVNGLIEEKNGNKYLVFDSTDDENKKVLTKYRDFWNVIKNEIEKVNGDKKGEYKQDFMEIKFSSDDNLPLNKILKFHMLAIVVRSVIDKDGKIYLSIVLDKCLYEIQK